MNATSVRNELRAGDLGRIVAHHGTTYGREHGVDPRFEAMVAATIAEAGRRGFPSARERVWIVESAGRHAGSIAVTDEGNRTAALRWVVLDRRLRGSGLGRRLIGEAVEFAEQAAYETLYLDTFSELEAAAHLYRIHGFELVSEDTAPRWGRESITFQRYEASFQRRAQPRSSRSAGESSRPFSVRA